MGIAGKSNRVTANDDSRTGAVDGASAAAETFPRKKTQINMMGVELIGDCRSYVRAKPLVSIAIAVAAGFIVNRLFGSHSGMSELAHPASPSCASPANT